MPSSADTYLHGHHDSVLRSHRWRTAENSAGYLLPRLWPAGPYRRTVGANSLSASQRGGKMTDCGEAAYVATLIMLYLDLPDTPLRANTQDQRQARSWFDRAVPLAVIETALLLACLRRNTRPPEVSSLPRIRSLAYFQPVIEELLENPAPEGYLQYLRFKLRNIIDKAGPAAIQKTTLSDDR